VKILRRASTSVRRRIAWIAGAALLILLGGAVLEVGVDRAFLQGLLATFIGAVLGFLVALYIDRHQQAEEAEDQRRRDFAAADLRRERDAAAAEMQRALDAEAEQRARDREAAAAKTRRVTVLTLLREELGRIPEQMLHRQPRDYAPTDRLVDVFWRSLSSSGELRWIEDLELLRSIATAYDLVAVEADLERRWQQARSVGPPGTVVTEPSIANDLRAHDRDTWRAACAAYKAVDAALIADGVEAGAEIFCPP
jgi:uncharacterized membrane protein YccC